MYLLLVNPKAGNQRYRRIEPALKRLLDKEEIKYNTVLIDDLVNVDDLLKQHVTGQTKAVVAVGGNGTVNAIIDALADYEDLPLAVIPISQSNHLANILGVRSWQTGARLLSDHTTKHLRLGKIGERYFAGSLLISPKRHLLASIFEKQNLIKKFLGVNLKQLAKEEHQVACTLTLDHRLTIRCQLSTMVVHFQDGFGKKIKVQLQTANAQKKKPEDSVLRANHVEVSSSLNMPVICGNESVAHTPLKIQAIGQTLPVLAPVSKTKKGAGQTFDEPK
ncbi:MAG: acylglycerol kinase family protein [Patescibacteria group bacterium]